MKTSTKILIGVGSLVVLAAGAWVFLYIKGKQKVASTQGGGTLSGVAKQVVGHVITVPGPSHPLLNYGDSGDAVFYLQTKLNETGNKTTLDSSFGDQTLSAVKTFQKSKGLTPDGSVGLDTWAQLELATINQTL